MGDVRARVRIIATASVLVASIVAVAPPAFAATTPSSPTTMQRSTTYNCSAYWTITTFAELQACDNDVTFTLSWSPPDSDGGSPVTGYALAVRPTGTSTWTTVETVPDTTLTVTLSPGERAAAGLAPLQTFDSTVQALNAEGASPADAQVVTNPMLPCVTGGGTLPCPFLLPTVTTPGSNVFTFTTIPRQYASATPTAQVQFAWRPSGTSDWTVAATVRTKGTDPVSGTMTLPSSVPIDIGVRGVNGPITSLWYSFDNITIPVLPAAAHPCLTGPMNDTEARPTLAKTFAVAAKACATKAPARD